MRWAAPLAVDLVCLLVFAVAGKGSHEPGAAASVVLAIVWPFAAAALLAHAGLLRSGRRASRPWPEGAVVLGVTYVLGLALRALSGRGLALGFLVVGLLFLALTLLGWRLVVRLAARLVAARRSSRSV